MLPRLIRRLLRLLAALALVAVASLALLLASLYLEHKTKIELPTPSGHFAIGRTTYAWVNAAETDDLAPPPAGKRTVLVWMWYPAAAPATPTTLLVAKPAAPAEYLPAPWRAALAQYSGVLMTQFLTRDLSRVRAHSTSDPDVSPEQRSYPVVIMRAGGGALTTDFTTLAEDLASHGYFVVGFDAPYRTIVVVLPDNRVVTRPPAQDAEGLPAGELNRLANKLLPMWTSDTKFVVSQLEHLNAADPSGKFTGRLDIERLGMFGHSFGGATALQFCHDDPRCKAGIDIDGAPFGSVVRDGLTEPFMFLLSDHGREQSDAASQQIHTDFQSIYDRLPSGRLFITICGANHFSFSDQILLKSHFVIALLRILGIARLDPRRGLAITTDYVHTFFDVHLKNVPVTQLDKLPQLYREVRLAAPQ